MIKRSVAGSSPILRSVAEAERLRNVLDSIGFNESGVRGLLHMDEFPSLKATDLPLLLHRTGHGRPLDTCVRLFLMERPVDREAASQLFQPLDLRTVARMGLIRSRGPSVEARIKLLPFQGSLVAFDGEKYLQSSSSRDYVMGIGQSSLTLASLTVRRPVQTTLDLGTGCGIQALLAAAHSERVVATDLNARAVAMTDFNARLNGRSNITAVRGHLFEPVSEDRFDLIVSNPPFVISPENRYIYRDGGLPGDELCRQVLREAAGRLTEGGFCHVLCNWGEYEGEDWRKTVRAWAAGLECDAWVIRSESRDPATYASTWIQHTERHKADDAEKRLDNWLAYFDSLGVASVGAGMVTLRRKSGHKHWFRADDAPPSMLGPSGEDVARSFILQDFLETVQNDEPLLQSILRVSPDLELEQRFTPSPDGWAISRMTLRKSRGLAYAGTSDTLMANLIAACDGERTLAAVLDQVLPRTGYKREEIIVPFCRTMRNLILQGFLLPPSVT